MILDITPVTQIDWETPGARYYHVPFTADNTWGRIRVPLYVACSGKPGPTILAIGGTHGGSMALVGEAGPEMVWLPTGAQVTNAVATRSKRESIEARRGGDINIYGPMTLNPAGSDAYAAIQQEMMGGARR